MINILTKLKHKVLMFASPAYREEYKSRVNRAKAVAESLQRSKAEIIARIEVLIEKQMQALRRLQTHTSKHISPGEIAVKAEKLQRKIIFNQARLRAIKENRKSHEIDIKEYIGTLTYFLYEDTQAIDGVGVSDTPPFLPIPRKTDSHP